MPKALPTVALACLCERVLTEKDGVLTLVRLVDQFTVIVPPSLPEDFKPHVSFVFVLGLRANGLEGQHTVTLDTYGPTKPNPPQDVPVAFPLGELGAINLIITMVIAVENLGMCRIEVSFDGEPLTTVPFRLVPGSQIDEAVEPR